MQKYNQSHTKNSKQNKPYLKTGHFYYKLTGIYQFNALSIENLLNLKIKLKPMYVDASSGAAMVRDKSFSAIVNNSKF